MGYCGLFHYASCMRSVVLAASLFLALTAASSFANDESDALVVQGLELLQAGELLAATDQFIAAYDADPTDGQAVFFVGVGMNRLGDHVQAIVALQEARSLGYDGPELAFETGWALLALGQYDSAIQQFETYEAMQPGRGKTSEFLARAYLAKGDTQRANALFNEAVARDPALTSSVDFQRSALEFADGDPEQANLYLENIASNDPNSALGQYLNEELEQLASAAPQTEAQEQKIWSIIASLAIGHDSNAIALGDAQPLPSGITNDSGSYIQGAVSGSVLAFARPGIDQLVVNATLSARRYGDNLSAVDSESWSIGANYQARIRSDVAISLQPFLGGNLSDASTTNRYAGIRGAVQFESFDIFWEPYVSVSYTDYNEVGFIAPADRRSGPTRVGGVTASWYWDGIDARMTFGGSLASTETKGTNFDNTSLSGFVAISKELANEVFADFSLTMTNTDYQNLDTRSTPVGTFKRADQTRIFTGQLSRQIWENISGYGRFTYLTNNSNITAFTYNRIDTTFGVVARF